MTIMSILFFFVFSKFISSYFYNTVHHRIVKCAICSILKGKNRVGVWLEPHLLFYFFNWSISFFRYHHPPSSMLRGKCRLIDPNMSYLMLCPIFGSRGKNRATTHIWSSYKVRNEKQLSVHYVYFTKRQLLRFTKNFNYPVCVDPA